MKHPKTKKEITENVLELLPKNSKWKTIELDKIIFAWWATGRSTENLILTEIGIEAFSEAKIEYYSCAVTEDSANKRATPKFWLDCSKCLQCPYYFEKLTPAGNRIGLNQIPSTIRIYDHKTAMMIGLYGSLIEFIDSAKVNGE